MIHSALVLLLALQAEEAVSFGNVVVRVPADWKFEKKAEGLFLRPGGLKEDEALVVIVPPGTKAEGNLAEGFEKSWKQVAGERRIVKKAPGREMKTEGGTDGLMSVGLLETADGVRLITSVAVFKAGDRTEAVLAMTAQDHVFQRYSEALGSMLKGLRFKNVELPTYDLLVSMGYNDTAGKTTVYVLFRDGTWLPTLPPEGLDDLEGASARKRFEGSFGTHETKDGVLTLRRGIQTEALKLGADGTYRSVENGQFQRVPTSSGVRLEGRYVLHGGTGKFILKSDGGFEDLGASSAVFPSPALFRDQPETTGGYEIFNNSIYMAYAGRDTRRKLSFLVLPKAGDANPEFILIRGYWFKKE
jgi:hypothetical protein